jgi:hypothetical protein
MSSGVPDLSDGDNLEADCKHDERFDWRQLVLDWSDTKSEEDIVQNIQGRTTEQQNILLRCIDIKLAVRSQTASTAIPSIPPPLRHCLYIQESCAPRT